MSNLYTLTILDGPTLTEVLITCACCDRSYAVASITADKLEDNMIAILVEGMNGAHNV